MTDSMEYRSGFETFKSNVCHSVHDMGDMDFIRFLCVFHMAPELCWFRFIRMTSGLPSPRAMSMKRIHDG